MTRTPKNRSDFKPCNLCGCLCAGEISESSVIPAELGLIDCVASGGYESTPGNGDGPLDDGMSYCFSLCEFCLDWLFVQFKIPPKATCYFGDEAAEDPTGYVPAEQRVRNDDWRTYKAEFFYEFNRRKAARSIKP